MCPSARRGKAGCLAYRQVTAKVSETLIPATHEAARDRASHATSNFFPRPCGSPAFCKAKWDRSSQDSNEHSTVTQYLILQDSRKPTKGLDNRLAT